MTAAQSRRSGIRTAPAKARPRYARALRLKHLRPGGLLCFLYFEGAIALGTLLALAELANWWAVLVLPLTVAVMVKFNDVVAGASARSGARAQPQTRSGRQAPLAGVAGSVVGQPTAPQGSPKRDATDSPADASDSAASHRAGSPSAGLHSAASPRDGSPGAGRDSTGSRGDGSRGDGSRGDGSRGDGSRGDGSRGDSSRDEPAQGGGTDEGAADREAPSGTVYGASIGRGTLYGSPVRRPDADDEDAGPDHSAPVSPAPEWVGSPAQRARQSGASRYD